MAKRGNEEQQRRAMSSPEGCKPARRTRTSSTSVGSHAEQVRHEKEAKNGRVSEKVRRNTKEANNGQWRRRKTSSERVDKRPVPRRDGWEKMKGGGRSAEVFWKAGGREGRHHQAAPGRAPRLRTGARARARARRRPQSTVRDIRIAVKQPSFPDASSLE